MTDLHPQRLKCKTGLYILLLVIVCIAIIMVLQPTQQYNGNQHKKKTKRHKRDYIDITDISYKIEKQFFYEQNLEEINVYSPSKRKPKEKYCHVYKGRKLKNAHCVPFKSRRGTKPICIFDPREDKMISSYIKDYGTWEPDLLNIAADILEDNLDMQFLDLGCNLGVFTINAAVLGRRVIAVDILPTALDNLQESLRRGNIEDNVTLVLNAISNTREKQIVNIVPENYGGSHVIDGNKSTNRTGDVIINSITMDDLLEVVKPGEIFIKMDIEGTEWKALENSKEFFQMVNVRFLLMEWMLHKGKKSGQHIIHFFTRNGLLPYLDYKNREILKIERSQFWPDNVLWAKR